MIFVAVGAWLARLAQRFRRYQQRRALRHAGGRFSFDIPMCACGRPFSLSCDAPVPEDYFTDVSYRTGLFALRSKNDTEARASYADVKADASTTAYRLSWGDELEVVVDVARRAACVGARSTRHHYPRHLSPSQVDTLSRETPEAWGEFLRSLPADERLDIQLRPSDPADAALCEARILCSRDSLADASGDVQVNVGGFAHLAEAPRTRSGARRLRRVGPCSWTRPRGIRKVRTSFGTFVVPKTA